VYCDSCSDGGHAFANTDSQGFYSFPAVYSGRTALLVTKPGYAVVDPVRTLPGGTAETFVTVNGDTRFDIEVVRR
jgi:hypothetical protein